MKQLFKTMLLFWIGFSTYITFEVIFRGYSYLLMGICSGLAILLLDKLNDRISWNMDLLLQGVIGSILITGMEFIIGEYRLICGLPLMWNYSNLPFNFDGVVCLSFSALWMLLSIVAIFIADSINYYVFNDSVVVPYYKVFGKTIIQFKEKQ